MWFPTIVTMIVHLVLAGLICWVVDEYNDAYTAYTFGGYMVGLAMMSINNHFTLLAGLIYDRENTLKLLDEKMNREGQ